MIIEVMDESDFYHRIHRLKISQITQCYLPAGRQVGAIIRVISGENNLANKIPTNSLLHPVLFPMPRTGL